MYPIRIKICGITRPEDALIAAQVGADAIGLVFFSGSKRCVTPEQAQKIVQILPPFVSVVALFVNASATEIHHIINTVPIDVLQFHGDEDAAFCRQFHRPYLKAVRVRKPADIQAAFAQFPDARAILFDAYVADAYGGTGHTFDWSWLPENANKHWILSGGLNTTNITTALQISKAQAVDVSSGVESAAGIKDSDKIHTFITACRQYAN
ncbi:MAG: phosphoribosylanthranilate isomerase [Alysiella sp.]|uniref:phosphoribosylanthranilate isomerase n=1 Tax=Alysiella sp. TaxID=1872483 RepID=UPI0026DBD68D|nr:phosphoribosylanthranilate isomerase [Alysiella sp.]MDO4433857.1 phosphoribosylanthranilate isomerase [Alysiella sp.]